MEIPGAAGSGRLEIQGVVGSGRLEIQGAVGSGRFGLTHDLFPVGAGGLAGINLEECVEC